MWALTLITLILVVFAVVKSILWALIVLTLLFFIIGVIYSINGIKRNEMCMTGEDYIDEVHKYFKGASLSFFLFLICFTRLLQLAFSN